MANAFDAFDPSRAYAHAEGMRRDRGRVAAGQQMAAGDRGGAIDTLYQGGDLETGNTLERQGVQDQQQAQQFAAQQDKAGREEKLRQGEALLDLGERVARLPPGQRKAAFDQWAPQLGIGAEMSAGMTEDDFTDENIMLFKDSVKKQLVNLGGGGAASWDPNTGAFEVLREPTQKAPVGFTYGPDGNLQIDPGYVAGQGQLSNVRAAGTAAHRAPPRPRAAAAAPPARGYNPQEVKWD